MSGIQRCIDFDGTGARFEAIDPNGNLRALAFEPNQSPVKSKAIDIRLFMLGTGAMHYAHSSHAFDQFGLFDPSEFGCIDAPDYMPSGSVYESVICGEVFISQNMFGRHWLQ